MNVFKQKSWHGAGHRRGLTLVELLVTITILSILIALVLPGFASARESARRAACLNNLGQVGKGIMSYDSSMSHLPGWRMSLPGFTELSGDCVSWSVAILPFLGEREIFDWYESYASNPPGTDDARQKRLPRYVCPSVLSNVTASAALSYMGNGGTAAELLNGTQQWRGDGVFFDTVGAGTYDPLKTSVARISDRDGSSSTMLLTERAGLHAPLTALWSAPPLAAVADANAVLSTHVVHHPPTAALVGGHSPLGRRIVNPTPETTISAAADWQLRYPSSLHEKGASVSFCDGRTQFMSEKVAPWVYCQMLTSDRRHLSVRATAWETYDFNGSWVRYVFDERDLTPKP